MAISKTYYRIEFKLLSPLTVGSGQNDRTDSDIVCDNMGNAYIPGSALAGIARSLWPDEKTKKLLFGNVVINTDDSGKKETESDFPSSLIFYDACQVDGDAYVSIRDSVSLDEYKTGKPGSKFDREVLEPGPIFVTYVESNLDDENTEYGFESFLADIWFNGRIRMGARTTRGYGILQCISIKKQMFCLPNDADKWLEFNMYISEYMDSLSENTEKQNSSEVILKLGLQQEGGISIRRYTTNVSEDDVEMPDFEQLTLKNGNIPVIPGTSWAGAFRHRMSEFLPKDKENDLFGYVKQGKEKTKTRSKIVFSETQLKEAVEKVMTRNAIDRFSGGSADGALFTERTFYNGTGELEIRLLQNTDKKTKAALAAAVADLHYGFLAVGGLTAIGRGLFSITTVNGKPVRDDIFNQVLKEIGQEA